MYKINLSIRCLCHEENIVWFVPCDTTSLFKLNILTGEIILIATFSEIEKSSDFNFIAMAKIDDRIYLAPYHGDYFIKYDLGDDSYEMIKCEISDDKEKRKFSSYKVHNNKIYFIGCDFPMIAIWDTDNEVISYVKAPACVAEKIFESHCWSRISLYTSYVYNDKIYIINCVNNNIWIYDTQKNTSDIYSVKTLSKGFNDIVMCDGVLVLTPRNTNRLILVNLDKMTDSEFCICNCEKVGHHVCIQAHNDKSFLFDLLNGNIFLIDQTGLIKKGRDFIRNNRLILPFGVVGKYYIYSFMNESCIYKVNMDTFECEKTDIYISENDYKKLYKEYLKRYAFVKETVDITYIIDSVFTENNVTVNDFTDIGKKISDTIIAQVRE